MDSDLIYLTLVILTLALALNLFLTFQVITRADAARNDPNALLSLPSGSPAPPFEARRAADGERLTRASLADEALVLVFLSSACPKCRAKIPELEALLPAMRRQGVQLWIAEPPPVDDPLQLVGNSSLRMQAVRMDALAMKAFNPFSGSPFYVFLDADLIVQASGYIGDGDWEDFIDQIRQDIAA